MGIYTKSRFQELIDPHSFRFLYKSTTTMSSQCRRACVVRSDAEEQTKETISAACFSYKVFFI